MNSLTLSTSLPEALGAEHQRQLRREACRAQLVRQARRRRA